MLRNDFGQVDLAERTIEVVTRRLIFTQNPSVLALRQQRLDRHERRRNLMNEDDLSSNCWVGGRGGADVFLGIHRPPTHLQTDYFARTWSKKLDKPAWKGILIALEIVVFVPLSVYISTHVRDYFGQLISVKYSGIVLDIIIVTILIWTLVSTHRFLNRFIDRRYLEKGEVQDI